MTDEQGAIPLPDPPLDDGVLLLRPPREADIPEIVTYCQDPEAVRWTEIPSPYGKQDARAWIARAEQTRMEGNALALVACARDGRLVGSCSLAVVSREQSRGEIGYLVAPWARRQGFGTRCLRLLSRWGIEVLGLERIEVLVQPANEPSLRLVRSAGLTEEGLLRSYREQAGARRDFVLFSLIRSDLERMRRSAPG